MTIHVQKQPDVQKQSDDRKRPRRMFVTSYSDIVLYVFSAIGMLALGALLWLAGGYFTLVALGALLVPWGISVSTSGSAWFIPVLFSVIEIATFRFRGRLPRWTLAIGVLLTILDLFSTVYGVVVAIGGLELKFFTGYSVPPVFGQDGKTHPVPVLIGTGVSAVLTFGPEQVVLNALGMLYEVVLGLWKWWRGR